MYVYKSVSICVCKKQCKEEKKNQTHLDIPFEDEIFHTAKKNKHSGTGDEAKTTSMCQPRE